MVLRTTTDAATVAALADAAVAADPVRNTIFGSIAAAVGSAGAAPFAAHPADEPLMLAARSQADTPLTVTANWTGPAELVAVLERLDPPPAAVAGPGDVVDEIVAGLGRPVTQRVAERLYRLERLIPPRAVPGRGRLIRDDERALLIDWLGAFSVEAMGRPLSAAEAHELGDRGMGSDTWVWVDDTDAPRSVAVRHEAVHRVARIGPVYTPPEARGQGFGSAVTAAATQDILDAGATPCLFTDLANPTSNRIYEALGYETVLDRVAARFD